MVKEFKATGPVSKWSGLRVYRRATSGNAQRFPAALCEQAPFPIRSIQGDGGSEFRNEFEQACQTWAFPCMCCPRESPSATAVWRAPMAPAAMSSPRSMRGR